MRLHFKFLFLPYIFFFLCPYAYVILVCWFSFSSFILLNIIIIISVKNHTKLSSLCGSSTEIYYMKWVKNGDVVLRAKGSPVIWSFKARRYTKNATLLPTSLDLHKICSSYFFWENKIESSYLYKVAHPSCEGSSISAINIPECMHLCTLFHHLLCRWI